MWVNLGCGEYYARGGWINVDWKTPHQVDLELDLAGPLPWTPGTITRAYLGHVMEHMTIEDGTGLLKRLHECMAPAAEVMIVGPDIERAQDMFDRGELEAEWLRLVREGGDRWPGDQHQWLCEPRTLIGMLKDAGYQNIQEYPIWVVPEVWPCVSRDVEWQCAVGAMA